MIMIHTMSQTLFKRAFLFLCITGALNWAGVTLYLYWSLWWYDVLMHFLGGLTVGFATLWLVRLRTGYNFSLVQCLRIVLYGGIFVGIVWEIFELYYHVTTFDDGIYFVTDTMGDLIMDTIGALVAGVWGYNILKKND